MRGEAEIDPAVIFFVNNSKITKRELQLLGSLSTNRSQNKAAKELGISVPVLNKRIKAMEKKLGEPLIETTNLSTKLTPGALELLEMERRMNHRLSLGRLAEGLVIGATPVYEDRIRKVLDEQDALIVSDDRLNLQMFVMGELDILLLDDPDNLLDLTGSKNNGLVEHIVEISKDRLIHFRRGHNHLRFGYGAQRIGYRSLQAMGQPANVVGSTKDISELLGSGHSFFLNRSLIELYTSQNRALDLRGEDVDIQLEFTLNAVILKDVFRPEERNVRINEFLKELEKTFRG